MKVKTVLGFFDSFICAEDAALGHDYRFPFHSPVLWIKQSSRNKTNKKPR